ncbi:MAG TPA: AtpZ/AtpI family protein, partial [Acidimicrobiia bacterium]|nr:AtpZ/AtpI family protein [Acidimicrobiia bacterium]
SWIWPCRLRVNTLPASHPPGPLNQHTNKGTTSALSDGWAEGGSFLGSVLSGALLGYLGDLWLGTDPWLVVTGIVLGSYSGFMRAWHYSKKMEEDPRER